MVTVEELCSVTSLKEEDARFVQLILFKDVQAHLMGGRFLSLAIYDHLKQLSFEPTHAMTILKRHETAITEMGDKLSRGEKCTFAMLMIADGRWCWWASKLDYYDFRALEPAAQIRLPVWTLAVDPGALFSRALGAVKVLRGQRAVKAAELQSQEVDTSDRERETRPLVV